MSGNTLGIGKVPYGVESEIVLYLINLSMIDLLIR